MDGGLRAEGKDSICFEEAGFRVCVRHGWAEPLRGLLINPVGYIERGGRLIKDDRWVKAWRVELGDGRGLFLKAYESRGVVDMVKDLIRPSRAKRAWQKGLLAESIGLRVPQTLAFIEESGGAIGRRCYIVQEYIEDGLNLYFFIRAHGGEEPTILERVATHIAGMHRKGWFHGDLKWPNVLLTDRELYFIDIEASLLKRPLPEAYMLKDLARFARDMALYGAPQRAVECFYATYWRANPIGGDSPASLRERVERERGFRKAKRAGD